jgi:2-haloacid dehalogenase
MRVTVRDLRCAGPPGSETSRIGDALATFGQLAAVLLEETARFTEGHWSWAPDGLGPDRDAAASRLIGVAAGNYESMTASRPATVLSMIVFDVNETLSDMTPLAGRFTDVGAPAQLAKLWFAGLLRDGFARTAAGVSERFSVLAAASLRTVLHGVDLDRDLDSAIDHVLDGFAHLPVHPDVPDGVRALRADGYRLVTLSNGSADVAQKLLERAGLAAEFDRLLSVEQAGTWKPAPGSYRYAASTCGVAAEEMLLVAVHPWDIDGAARAGLRTAWINRAAAPYPDHFSRPDYNVTGLDLLVAELKTA